MTYQALARKWRPRHFDQIVGQPHIVKVLSSALTQDKIHHAYLFTGYHGVGKTTLARIFAKCLNCETGVTATPCEQCQHCREIDEGRFPDLFEIDAASRTKVEDTRELLDNIPYSPTKGRYKVYLIDEVHMLSGHSFNALLKTLEEPPAHVKFLLATTDPQKLPATVLSRCLQFHLSKMTTEQIENQLSTILNTEKIPFEPEALSLIAESANGSMRDALSLLDQCIAYGNGKIKTSEIQAILGLSNRTEITKLIEFIHSTDANSALELTKTWGNNGINFSNILSELLVQLYQISVAQSINQSPNIAIKNLANLISREDVQLYYQIALMGQRDITLAPTAQIGFEMIVMRMIAFKPLENDSVKKTPPTTVSKKPPERQNSNPLVLEKNEAATDWNALLSQLNLTGPTLAFAQHCTMSTFTKDELHLTLAPKYAALMNPRHQQRIQESITSQLNRQICVKITIAPTSAETPAETVKRERDTRQESVKKTMSTDPTVERIVKTFDARLIPESIEPINS